MPGDEAAKLNGHANNNHTVVAVEREREKEKREINTHPLSRNLVFP
jgi:hypothetical protein